MFSRPKAGDPGEFWTWFEREAPKIGRRYTAMTEGRVSPDSVMRAPAERLRQYHSGLALEIGWDEDLFDLVVSSDGVSENIEPVLRLIRAAPKIDGWKFTAFRRRFPMARDELLKIGPATVRSADVRYALGPLEDGKCDAVIAFREQTLPAGMDIRRLGFLILDQSIGEYDVMTKIGLIEFTTFNDTTESDFSPIADFPIELDGLFPATSN